MMIRRKRESGFGALEALIAILIVVMLGAGAWFVYRNNINDNKHDPQAIQQEDISDSNIATELYKDSELDIQFRYRSGIVQPSRKTSQTGGQVKAGIAYFYNQPRYSDAATVQLGSKDLAYNKTGFAMIGLGLFGDITIDLKDSATLIESVIKNCPKDDDSPRLGCARIITNTKDQLTYVNFDGSTTAYLATIKHLPSKKRMANVSFGFRVDITATADGEDANSPIDQIIGADDLEFFNVVSRSLRNVSN